MTPKPKASKTVSKKPSGLNDQRPQISDIPVNASRMQTDADVADAKRLLRSTFAETSWLNVVLFFYAILTITMGVTGYLRANSPWSLVAGVTCGLVVLVSVILHRFKPRTARTMALIVALLLVGKFAMKTFQNELYPSGVMFTASIAVLICLYIGHLMGRQSRNGA